MATKAEIRIIKDKIHNITIATAAEWDRKQDQFVFCLDHLDLSLVMDGDSFCERWVDLMERKMMSVLAKFDAYTADPDREIERQQELAAGL